MFEACLAQGCPGEPVFAELTPVLRHDGLVGSGLHPGDTIQLFRAVRTSDHGRAKLDRATPERGHRTTRDGALQSPQKDLYPPDSFTG